MSKTRKVESGTEQNENMRESKKECMTFSCPVYGKSASEPHLPDVQSVIKEGWYFVQKTRIVNSKVVLEHEFTHCYNEEENIGMEEPCSDCCDFCRI